MDSYRVERKYGLVGPQIVNYLCSGCGMALESALSDAGTSQECPFCKAQFIVPGMAELERERAEEENKEQTRALVKQAREAERVRVETSRVSVPPAPPPPPEMVWYGLMFCRHCGYQWKSRRSTPPARCANCSSRNIQVIKQPKQLFSWGGGQGCLVLVMVFGGIVTLGIALLAMGW